MASVDAALRNMLVSYNHNAMAFTDIRTVLRNFKDLRTQMKPFTYGNGTRKSLVCLEGTIPISYRTKKYNIPVIIWLHETHPYHAPMAYVQPTTTMNIKPGPNVAENGSVSMPYLSDWKQGQSDLNTLVSVLCVVFGDSPPVFAKPKNQPPYAASGTGMPIPQSYPSAGSGSASYPAAAPISYPPQSQSTAYQTNNAPNAAPQGYNPYGGSSQPSPYGPTTTTAVQGGYPMYGQGTGYGGGAPYPTAAPTSYSTPTAGSYPPPTSTGYPGYPPTATAYTNPAADPTLNRQKSFGLSDEEIKKSLHTAVEDKMRRRLKDIFATHKAEMDVLRKTQQDLNEGRIKLDSMAKTIETESSECENALSLLSTKIPELTEEMEKRGNEQELPAEDAIETTAPIYRQLLQSFAEEQAIEDTLFILGDSLRREVIGIEIYLKKVRDLSRKQFMLRALMQKCREKAGLSDIYS